MRIELGLDRFLARLEPGAADIPPSMRYHRIILIDTGAPILEMRDPNDGQGSGPATKSRHQYLLAGGLLYTRHLPPAPETWSPDADTWRGEDGPRRWELCGGTGRPTGILRDYVAAARHLDIAPDRPGVECRIESRDLDGRGVRDHEVYYLPPSPEDYWRAVTGCACPVPGCGQTVVWWEAGYVPGYRVCLARAGEDTYSPDTLRHRFLARGDSRAPCLIREEV